MLNIQYLGFSIYINKWKFFLQAALSTAEVGDPFNRPPQQQYAAINVTFSSDVKNDYKTILTYNVFVSVYG